MENRLLEIMNKHYQLKRSEIINAIEKNSITTTQELRDLFLKNAAIDFKLYLTTIVTKKDYKQLKKDIEELNNRYKFYYDNYNTFASFWLHYYIKHNDSISSIKLLKIGTCPNKYSKSVYFKAIEHENIDIIKALLYFNIPQQLSPIPDMFILETPVAGMTSLLTKKYRCIQSTEEENTYKCYFDLNTSLEYAQYLFKKNESNNLKHIITLLSLQKEELSELLSNDVDSFLKQEQKSKHDCICF